MTAATLDARRCADGIARSLERSSQLRSVVPLPVTMLDRERRLRRTLHEFLIADMVRQSARLLTLLREREQSA